MKDPGVPRVLKIGQIYTTSWANNPGCRWRLISMDNRGNCVLETLKTKRIVNTQTNQLREWKR